MVSVVMCSRCIYKPLLALLIITGLLVGCESNSGSKAEDALNQAASILSGGSETNDDVTETVNGRAIKGIILNGIVEVYAINNGSYSLTDSPIANSNTDQFGKFELELSLDEDWYYIRVTGHEPDDTEVTLMECDAEVCGTFNSYDLNHTSNINIGDEVGLGDKFSIHEDFNMGTVVSADEIRDAIDSKDAITISPLTHMLVSKAEAKVGGLIKANIDQANRELKELFSFTGDIRDLNVVDLNSSSERTRAIAEELKATLLSSAFLNYSTPTLEIANTLKRIETQDGELGSGESNPKGGLIQLIDVLYAAQVNAESWDISTLEADIMNQSLTELIAITEQGLTNIYVDLNVSEGGKLNLEIDDRELPCEPGCDAFNLSKTGQTADITALANSGYQFDGWGNDCPNPVTELVCRIQLNQTHEIDANFSVTPIQVTQHQLIYSVDNTDQNDNELGLVGLPSGQSCSDLSPCTMTFDANESVTFTASAHESNTTIEWLLDGEQTCQGQTSCTISMDQDHKLTTRFEEQSSSSGGTDLVTLRITVEGPGSVSESNIGIDCTSGSCDTALEEGKLVNLIATADSGYLFAGWSGLCEGSGTCARQLNQDQAVTATFTEPVDRLVTVVHSGNGTVADSGGHINCTTNCSTRIDLDVEITLTAVAATNYQFTGWGDTECVSNPQPHQCTLLIDSHKTIEVNFVQVGESVVLSWDAPTTREDGSNLEASDIQSYIVYYGESSGNYTETSTVEKVNNEVPTTKEISTLDQGKEYFFTITTVDNFGRESTLSDETSIVLN